MSTTPVLPTATRPSTLLRRPPPPAAASAGRGAVPPRIVVTGALLEDAASHTEPATGRAAFTIVLEQAGGGPAIWATRWVGDGPEAAWHAAERARGLRRGDIVSAHGDGLRMRYRRSELTLELAHVRDIELEEPAA